MNTPFTMQFSDFCSPEFHADPYPLYRQLREAGTLVRLAPTLWVSGRYDVCDAALRDRRMGRAYMNAVRARYGDETAQGPVFASFAKMMLMMNPPDHTRLRSLLMKAFNASQAGKLVETVQRIADKLVDRVAGARSFDLMRDYAVPLPLEVICHLLDVPSDGGIDFGTTIGDLVQTLELAPMNPARLEAANAAVRRLEDHFRPILRERRQRPGDDLISRLLQVEDGDRMTEEEILANIILLFLAGHETTSNMMGNALVALHRHPEQLIEVLQDPALLPGAIAECIRYDGSVQLSARGVLEDMEIDGIALPRGHTVYLFLGAANRDPAAFAHPDRLDIHRPLKDQRALTFGGGLHHCLGARLAQIEMEVGLGTLLRRIPDLRISNLGDLRWHPRNTLRGVESLRAAW